MVSLPIVLLIFISSNYPQEKLSEGIRELLTAQPEKGFVENGKSPDVPPRQVNDLTTSDFKFPDDHSKGQGIANKKVIREKVVNEKDEKDKIPVPLYSLVKNDCGEGYALDENGVCQKTISIRSGKRFDSDKRRKRHILNIDWMAQGNNNIEKTGDLMKSEVVTFYNRTKVGMDLVQGWGVGRKFFRHRHRLPSPDLVDQLVHYYHVSRNSRRCPLVNLSWELIKPQIQRGSKIRNCLLIFDILLEQTAEEYSMSEPEGSKDHAVFVVGRETSQLEFGTMFVAKIAGRVNAVQDDIQKSVEKCRKFSPGMVPDGNGGCKKSISKRLDKTLPS